jgi:hypothetical protein
MGKVSLFAWLLFKRLLRKFSITISKNKVGSSSLENGIRFQIPKRRETLFSLIVMENVRNNLLNNINSPSPTITFKQRTAEFGWLFARNNNNFRNEPTNIAQTIEITNIRSKNYFWIGPIAHKHFLSL